MKVIKACFKVIAAGLVSSAVICGLLFFYNILPVHEKNIKGNTDYVWPPNSIWVKATEGISFGKFDENGFNNISAVDNPDIIILGSSHMEATNVMQDENAAYLLSERLAGRYSVYNMGISDHNFFKVCQYIPANLKLYDKAPKMVIIETSTINVSQKNADKVISSSVKHAQSHSTGIMGILQKVPFFRALYHQTESGLLRLFMPDSNKAIAEDDVKTALQEDNAKIQINDAAYAELFSYLKKIEVEHGTQILIFYHPTEKLMSDGTIYFDRSEYLKVFTEYANNYDITFIDMTDRFEKMYYEENHVAHGFCTGQLATGHINKYGHAAVADELYKAINKLEDGELCQ